MSGQASLSSTLMLLSMLHLNDEFKDTHAQSFSGKFEYHHTASTHLMYLGFAVGSDVGDGVGAGVGRTVGSGVGASVGADVGLEVGSGVGWEVGVSVGAGFGRTVGSSVGASVGADVGSSHLPHVSGQLENWPKSV